MTTWETPKLTAKHSAAGKWVKLNSIEAFDAVLVARSQLTAAKTLGRISYGTETHLDNPCDFSAQVREDGGALFIDRVYLGLKGR